MTVLSLTVLSLTCGHQPVADIYKSVTFPWHQHPPIQHQETCQKNVETGVQHNILND